MSKNGLILLTPTSIAYTGTSATIGVNGSVSFTSCTSLSLNGAFTADYDNYMVVCRYDKTGSDRTIYYRLRSSGTDDSALNYTWQRLIVTGTTVSSARTADNVGNISQSWPGNKNALVGYFYGPYLAQPTAFRSVTVHGESSAAMQDCVWTHNQSSVYDGFTFLAGAAEAQSGRIAVYGVRK
jgi:hypothetical protein